MKTDREAKLECLKAATALLQAQKSSGARSEDVIKLAQKIYDWVNTEDKRSAREI